MENATIIEELKREIALFEDNWQDDLNCFAGWFHNYFCDEDGTKLSFHLADSKAIYCPLCGHNYNDDDKRVNAWYGILRGKAVDSSCCSAFVYQATGERKYLDSAKRILLFYSKAYPDFVPHIKDSAVDFSVYSALKKQLSLLTDQKKMYGFFDKENNINVVGPGKMFGQGLDDAVAVIKMAVTYTFIKEALSAKEKKYIVNHLFIPARDFLEGQQFVIHNITLWREVAIQAANLVSENEKNVSFERDLGIYDHLRLGVTREFLWYEGSFHYHFYVVEALSYLAFFLKQDRIDDQKIESSISEMLTLPVNCAFENGVLPNPNDGWPNISLQNYIGTYELAAIRYPNNRQIQSLCAFVRDINKEIPREKRIDSPITHIMGKLFLRELPLATTFSKISKSSHYPDSKFAILQNDYFRVFAKYGVNTTSHAHNDPFNFELSYRNKLLVKDLSNSGYGSSLSDHWYKTTFAHNTIIINDSKSCNILYHTDMIEKTETVFEVQSCDIYSQGEKISRRFEINDRCLNVQSKVDTDSQEMTMLVQHFDIAEKDCLFENNVFYDSQLTGFDKNFTKRIRKLGQPADRLSFRIVLENLEELIITFSLSEAATVYVLTTAGNPSTDDRMTIIFRKEGSLSVKMIVEAEVKENE